jgi:hypothetical protein
MLSGTAAMRKLFEELLGIIPSNAVLQQGLAGIRIASMTIRRSKK